MHKKANKTDQPSNCNGPKRLRQALRIETVILGISLLCTVFGKAVVIFKQGELRGIDELFVVALPDLLFFGVLLLIISVLYAMRPSQTAARGAIIISSIVCLWSVLNTVWLVRSGVQLHSGLLRVLARDFNGLWPLVITHVQAAWGKFLFVGLFAVCCSAILLKFFLKPSTVIKHRIYHLRTALKVSVVLGVILLMQQEVKSQSNSPAICEILGFSSHWQAIVSSVNAAEQDEQVGSRSLQAIEQVSVTKADGARPNIVVLLLESVSHSATSLGDAGLDTTPNLAELAASGINFDCTRVPVSHTTKALWASLTGTDPVIRADYAEAVPAEKTYASLPSILGRAGYRSSFFMMSKGSFECAPGLCHNLGFDWAWFRENLEDSSANLGYLGGDDMRIVEPAFDWIDSSRKPFLLTVMTSVAHDPFLVPGAAEDDSRPAYDRYLETVKYTDKFIGAIRQQLEARGLRENTIICVLGDHGTSFRDELDNGRWIPHEEVVRVPWVISWPAGIKQAKRVGAPCSQLDVTPTLLNLAGIKVAGARFAGVNALGELDPDRRFYFSSWYDQSPVGFVHGDRKVIYWPYLEKAFEYDLGYDRGELEPRIMGEKESRAIKDEILTWEKGTWVENSPSRYFEEKVFEHWQVISFEDAAWAYYISDPQQLELAVKRKQKLRN